jgi:hypothetical protein
MTAVVIAVKKSELGAYCAQAYICGVVLFLVVSADLGREYPTILGILENHLHNFETKNALVNDALNVPVKYQGISCSNHLVVVIFAECVIISWLILLYKWLLTWFLYV